MHNYLKDTIFDKNHLNPVHLYVNNNNLFKIISQEGPQRLLFIENMNMLCSAKATETIHEYMLQTLIDNNYVKFEELFNYRNNISKQYNMLIDNINNEEIDDVDCLCPLKIYSNKYYLIIRNVDIHSNIEYFINNLPLPIKNILGKIDIDKTYFDYKNNLLNDNLLTIFKNSLSLYNIKKTNNISQNDLIKNYNNMIIFISSMMNNLNFLKNNNISINEFVSKFTSYFMDFLYNKED